MKLSEQIVLITGSSRGLGLAIARAFHAEGACVVINYLRSAEAAHSVAKELDSTGGTVFVCQADVTEPEAVRALFTAAKQHFDGKPITTIVNNALAPYAFNGEARERLDGIPWASFDAQFRGAVRAALNTTQAALEDFKALHQRASDGGHGGRIINVGSNLVQNPVVPYHDYTAAKAGLLAFTRTAAKELGVYGVNVNMVAAGLVAVTDASRGTPSEVWEEVRRATPLGRVTTCEDVSGAVLFLASPWADGVSGQQVVVDGGLVMN